MICLYDAKGHFLEGSVSVLRLLPVSPSTSGQTIELLWLKCLGKHSAWGTNMYHHLTMLTIYSPAPDPNQQYTNIKEKVTETKITHLMKIYDQAKENKTENIRR